MSSLPGLYEAGCCANPGFRFAVNGVHFTLGSTDVVPPEHRGGLPSPPVVRGDDVCEAQDASPGSGRYSEFRVRQDGMNCSKIPHFRFGLPPDK
jgi:hypothetical protein